MPTDLNVNTALNDPLNAVGRSWNFFLKLFPWILGLIILGLIIYFVFFFKKKRLEKAFGRRRMELQNGAKLSKDPYVKNVFIYQSDTLKKLGKYDGHFIQKKLLYVLITRNILIDLIFGQKMIVAPKGAVRFFSENNQKNFMLVGNGFTYDVTKNLFLLTGDWEGLNIKVSKSLIDLNTGELLDEYSNKIARVWDQAVEVLDVKLKKELKGGEDVVNEEEK
ncbi:MAG: hypothetical protein ACTSPQ_21690 [Candidatus Helarchaeota archaeon]